MRSREMNRKHKEMERERCEEMKRCGMVVGDVDMKKGNPSGKKGKRGY